MSPRCRLRAANRRANGGGERDTDVLRASSESGLQREPYGSMVHAITYLLARGPRQVAMGWKSPRAIALFDAHTLPLDLTG